MKKASKLQLKVKHITQKFSYAQWLLICVTIALGFLLRFYLLNERAIHHDESLHAFFGKLFFLSNETGFYKYDPMLHGPLLYYLMPFAYYIFGITDQAIRVIPALLGSLLLLFPIFFTNILSKKNIVFIIILLAFSPTLIYWSRFLRHDIYMLFFICLSLAALTIKNSWVKYTIFSIAVTLQFTIKENAYLHLGLIIVFFVYSKSLVKEHHFFDFLFKNKLAILFACLISIFIYTYLFSGGFRYPEGILDGLYRKSLTYWHNQHQTERIAGPFIYNTLVISWYETGLAILILLTSFLTLKNINKLNRNITLSLIAVGVILALTVTTSQISSSSLAQYLKIKIPQDIFIFVTILSLGVSLTTHFLKNRMMFNSFLCYMFFANWFTYSYVGEKVPWLAIYPTFWGIIFVSRVLSENLKPKVLTATIGIVFIINIFITIKINFISPGSKTELISQVHTTREYQKMALSLRDNPFSKILVIKENNWPLSWFLHGKDNFFIRKKDYSLGKFDIILSSTYDVKTLEYLKISHRKHKIPLRHWWSPDYTQLTIKNFLKYLLFHTPWNLPGAQNIFFYRKTNEPL